MRAALFRAVPFVAVLAAAAVPAAAIARPGDPARASGDDRARPNGAGGNPLMRPSDAPGGDTPLPGARPAPPPEAPARAYPVDGPHRYSDGFGDRGGSHKGEDILADCRTPVRAVRDVTVRRVATEAAAGRYVVLHAAGSGADYVYMHLSAIDVAVGDRVAGGHKVGEVGRTGDATACHLHFEEWTAPGWYAGGHATDPLTLLRSLAGS